MITVRKATEADAEKIFAAEKAYMDLPWTLEQVHSEIESARATFLVAECDGVLDECDFGNIAVIAEFRRRGVARQLMTEFLSELGRKGVKSVFLEVRSDNAAAIALYERFGFTAINVRVGYYNSKDALIMKKSL